ncbi:uncharacterized protein MYCGRDRAFT_97974 [Zymoseptoria tritici IPO323]|uniref:Uncharacterized protein n=1 Tax=Zymoseptoria tritici (strain CBS 115943 / IPO323) TaxID=336722 RepID=F9XRY1_ZYMTI|nr:uncharacterized protein MYCGRDRAFT_97974 [Zymoseptoria tritici IPO323]EGP82021.1 hypothetical protein MYCGRDRAFT_97974 [Zymoseptoria tritici IPO323]
MQKLELKEQKLDTEKQDITQKAWLARYTKPQPRSVNEPVLKIGLQLFAELAKHDWRIYMGSQPRRESIMACANLRAAPINTGFDAKSAEVQASSKILSTYAQATTCDLFDTTKRFDTI